MDSETGSGPSSQCRSAADLNDAADMLLRGEVIIYPTETFYGLIGGVRFRTALERVNSLKGRDRGKPLPCVIGQESDLPELVSNINESQRLLMDRFWPGPLTLIFDAKEEVPIEVTGNTDTVGVRLTGHQGLMEIAKRVGPLVATSANLTGKDPMMDKDQMDPDLEDQVALFDGGRLVSSKGSTVLDARDDIPKLLRDGDVAVESLEQVLCKQIKKGTQ